MKQSFTILSSLVLNGDNAVQDDKARWHQEDVQPATATPSALLHTLLIPRTRPFISSGSKEVGQDVHRALSPSKEEVCSCQVAGVGGMPGGGETGPRKTDGINGLSQNSGDMSAN